MSSRSLSAFAINRRSALGLLGAAAFVPSVGMRSAMAAATDFTLPAADGRKARISHWPAQGKAKGTIAFFHGAVSAPHKYVRLIEPWAAAGYDVFAPLCVDSTDHPDHASYDRPAVWRLRVEDAALVADLCAERGGGHFIAAGHSYGGLTALALAGAKPVPPDNWTRPMADPRVRCAAAFSPPGPLPGLIDAAGFSSINAPILVQTGTKDSLPGFIDDFHIHLSAFDFSTVRPRYGLILDGVDHYFGGGICRPELPGPVQEAGLSDALAISIEFFGAHGGGSRTIPAALSARAGKQGGADLTIS